MRSWSPGCCAGSRRRVGVHRIYCHGSHLGLRVLRGLIARRVLVIRQVLPWTGYRWGGRGQADLAGNVGQQHVLGRRIVALYVRHFVQCGARPASTVPSLSLPGSAEPLRREGSRRPKCSRRPGGMMRGTGSRPIFAAILDSRTSWAARWPCTCATSCSVALASWKVASARLSAAAACTFCPTMMTDSSAGYRKVSATHETIADTPPRIAAGRLIRSNNANA